MNLAYFEEGQSLDSELLCGQDGNLYQIGGFSDNGTAWILWMSLQTFGSSRNDNTGAML